MALEYCAIYHLQGDEESHALQAWCDYEIVSLGWLGSTGPSRDQAPEEPVPGARKVFDKSRLVWRHILASLNGLRSGLKLGCDVGQGEIAGLPHLQKEGAASPHPIQLTIAAVFYKLSMFMSTTAALKSARQRPQKH